MKINAKIFAFIAVGAYLTACDHSSDINSLRIVKPDVISTYKKPNFLFIISDDMNPTMFNNLPEGRDENGKPRNLTPNLDRLIAEGSYLSQLYVASPVCTPSRYNILTGNYASRAQNREFTDFTAKNENQTVIQWNSFITPGVEKTIGSRLQALGYRTGFVGKNHVVESLEQLSEDEPPPLTANPQDPDVKAGLEYRHAALSEDIRSVGFDYADHLYHNNPRWLGIDALAVQNMDWITEGGLKFIDSKDERPFFLYFATTVPHGPTNKENSWLADPRITPRGILDTPPNVQPARETLTERINAAGLGGKRLENVLWLDDAIGALYDGLERAGELENTIIVFVNDHGQFAKGTLYEGGLHTQAFVWRKDGFACGSVCDMRLSNTDFLETLVEMAGGKDFEGYSDGRSFLTGLDGDRHVDGSSHYFELGYARAIVKGDYKYLALRYPNYAMKLTLDERTKLLEEYNTFRATFGAKSVNDDPALPFGHLEMVPGGGGAENYSYVNKPVLFDSDQLFHLKDDPQEQNNLALDPAYADKLKEMKAELRFYIDKLPGDFKID